MKYILLLLLMSQVVYGTSGQELSDIAVQFDNRNWNYHAALSAQKSHLLDYTNSEFLKVTKLTSEHYLQELSFNTLEIINLFYPEARLETQNDLILLKDSYTKAAVGYEVLSAFLGVISTERWDDPNPEGCGEAPNPLESADCGRRSRGYYAVSNLTNFQRDNLTTFKNAVLNELDVIRDSHSTLVVGPGPARVFQFLFDSRAIDKLIQQSYVSVVDPSDSDLRKKNITEIGRALIIQVYQRNGGKLENGDLKAIDLEKDACFSLAENLRANCQLEYVRALVWDKDYAHANSQQVTNLILDSKGVKVFFDSLIVKFTSENPEAVTRDQMLEFLERAYFTMALAYDLDSEHISANQVFFDKLTVQLKQSIDYLINKRNIIGLQIARGLQEVILFVEANR